MGRGSGLSPRGSESRGCDFISENVGSLTLSDSSRLSSLSPEDGEAGFVASLRHQLDHGQSFTDAAKPDLTGFCKT